MYSKYFNLADIDNQKVYNSIIVNMYDIVSCIDYKYGSNYIEDVERGEMPVQTLLGVINFGDYVYSIWDETTNKYIMIPFKVIYKYNIDKEIESVFVFYSCTPDLLMSSDSLISWLESHKYNIESNIIKLSDEEGYNIINNHNTCIISGSNIYKLK